MKLLYVTQKLHDQDRFTISWIEAFQKAGFEVEVICLEKRVGTMPFKVHSMGKERGASKLMQVFTYWKLITSLEYDRVFIHMAPVYGALGAWYWPFTRTPVYLWYTHWPMNLPLWVTTRFAKRFFCAGFTSLPTFEGDPRKIVTGHGIDLHFWKKQKNRAKDPCEILVVHRLCRSKRLEIGLKALTLLPDNYTMTVYGAPLEKDYVADLEKWISEWKLERRVRFMGTASMEELRDTIFPSHKILFNMAYETLDKTMAECLSAGMWLVTTPRNAASIGLDKAPRTDSPVDTAAFIKWCSEHECDGDKTYKLLEDRHDLGKTIEKMARYIRSGT